MMVAWTISGASGETDEQSIDANRHIYNVERKKNLVSWKELLSCYVFLLRWSLPLPRNLFLINANIGKPSVFFLRPIDRCAHTKPFLGSCRLWTGHCSDYLLLLSVRGIGICATMYLTSVPPSMPLYLSVPSLLCPLPTHVHLPTCGESFGPGPGASAEHFKS